MKRLISSIYIFILCAILMVPFSSSVNAAPSIVKPENSYVYYQSLIEESNGTHYSVNAISQYYYTERNYLGNTDYKSNNLPIRSKSSTNFKNLYNEAKDEATLCDRSVWNDKVYGEYSKLCVSPGSNTDMKSTKVSLRMNAAGDITIETANATQLNYIKIKYLIANKINSAYMFCDNNIICSGAKTTTLNKTNWSSDTNDGYIMEYNSSNIRRKFSIEEINTGAKIYSGYNVFNDMVKSKVTQARASGAYVIIEMGIIVGENNYVNYKVNRDIGSREFNSDITNINGGTFNHVVISNGSVNNQDTQVVNSIASSAALIKPLVNEKNTGGFDLLNDAFVNTVRPILIVVIGVLFIVVGTYTGVTVVKASDEPEVRSAGIKRIIGMFIGAFTICIILAFYEDIVKILIDLF